MVGPKTYLNQEEIEKDFLRFQDAMVKEDDKYHNLLTFLTGGTFLASTSIVSFFYSSNNTNDLFFLKVGWVLLVISFLCNVVSLRLSVKYHEEYANTINKKIAVSKSLPINIDATDTKGCNFLDQRQIWWSNFQIIFWLSGTIQLVLFFLFK